LLDSSQNSTTTSTTKDELYLFFEALVHPLRVRILTLLHENERMTYSELLDRLGIETGKLNFHFKKLVGLIEKDSDGYYKLTPKGTFAIGAIKAVREQLGIKEEKKVKTYFGRRLIAWIIDVFLVSLVSFGSFLFFNVAYYPVLPFELNIQLPPVVYTIIALVLAPYVGWPGIDPVTRVYMLSMLWMYWTIFEGYRGQSFGKIIMGIRIIKTDGSTPQVLDSAILSLGKSILLPIDVLAGLLLKILKKGYWIRFTEAYVRVKTIRQSLNL